MTLIRLLSSTRCPQAAALVLALAAAWPLVSAAAVPAGPGVAWRPAASDAEVDRAFATARAEGKPVFLYWGAVWCPPCANGDFVAQDGPQPHTGDFDLRLIPICGRWVYSSGPVRRGGVIELFVHALNRTRLTVLGSDL